MSAQPQQRRGDDRRLHRVSRLHYPALMLRKLARTSIGITGIHTMDGLRAGARQGLFGGQRRISIALYEQAVREDNADELTAEILERFGDDRGAYKRTYSDRFREFDRRSLDILRDNFSPDRPLKVHDVAVSDGRTAVDFFELLAPVFPLLEFTASDYSNSIKIVEALGGSAAFSESGEPLEMTWPPFVHNLSKRENWKADPIISSMNGLRSTRCCRWQERD